jgi:DNA polymerase-3 subunit chi
MGAVYFYRLTESPPEAVLAMLLGKALQAGWRVELRGTDPARLTQLDEHLWTGAENVLGGFLPHGLAGGPGDDDQPVLLTTSSDLAPITTCLMAIDGAAPTPGEVQALERCCIVFDGNDEAALAVARGQWKSLTDAGCSAQFWAQAGGRWTLQAEK